jgi:predicted site-specific integrase-resolvase
VGSGLNDSRKKLLDLLDKDWDVLVVEYKDRLTRFGFTYLEKVAHLKGARIEVINLSANNDDLDEELNSDDTGISDAQVLPEQEAP